MSSEFLDQLRKAFYLLRQQKKELFSVRDPKYDILSRSPVLDDPVRLRHLNDARDVCLKLWEEASQLITALKQKRVLGYNVHDCCLGFFVSDVWLSETAVGDTNSIRKHWTNVESCTELIKELFPQAKHDDLAKNIVRTRSECERYFGADSNEFSLTAETVKEVHHMLMEMASDWRKDECSNEFAMPYLHPEKIESHLTDLLTFVNEQASSEQTFDDRLLLCTIFFEQFLWIHPFSQGNGRTARMLFSILMRPCCPMVPISLFLRLETKPRELYLQSIRGNPPGAPICLAFYLLKCFTENGRNISRTVQLQPFINEAPSTLPVFNQEQPLGSQGLKELLETLQSSYPSITLPDLAWLEKNVGAALVVKGKSSCYEQGAVVVRAATMEEIQAATVNSTFRSFKVFYWAELFSSEPLVLGEYFRNDLVKAKPRRGVGNTAMRNPRLIYEVVASFPSSKLLTVTKFTATVIIDTGAPACYLLLPQRYWKPSSFNEDVNFAHSQVSSELHDCYRGKVMCEITINGQTSKQVAINLSRRNITESHDPNLFHGFDGLIGLSVLDQCYFSSMGSDRFVVVNLFGLTTKKSTAKSCL